MDKQPLLLLVTDAHRQGKPKRRAFDFVRLARITRLLSGVVIKTNIAAHQIGEKRQQAAGVCVVSTMLCWLQVVI